MIPLLLSLCRVVELTGDVTPDMRAIAKADLIVTTPEKWDGVSRSWQNRSYVQKVAILIIDEIHLLGERRQCRRPYAQNLKHENKITLVHSLLCLVNNIICFVELLCMLQNEWPTFSAYQFRFNK